jgi:hypothetical protein
LVQENDTVEVVVPVTVRAAICPGAVVSAAASVLAVVDAADE